MRFVVTAVVAHLVFASSSAAAAGFRQTDPPDPPGRPLAIGIWFPSSAHTSSERVGPFQQNVALNASIILGAARIIASSKRLLWLRKRSSPFLTL